MASHNLDLQHDEQPTSPTTEGVLNAAVVLVSAPPVPVSVAAPTNVVLEDEKQSSIKWIDFLYKLNSFRYEFMIVFAMMLITVVGLVTGFLVHSKKSSNGYGPATLSASNYQERYIQTREELSNLTNPGNFVDPSTPQSQALSWLVYRDQALPPDAPVSRLAQRFALMVLFYACSGATWSDFVVPWSADVTHSECNFQGIQCNDQGQVVSLELSQQRASGQLPDEIGLLSNLVIMDLSDNLLQGSLPESLYAMTDLGE